MKLDEEEIITNAMLDSLNEAEILVFNLVVARCFNYHEVGKRLNMPYPTIAGHMNQIYKKVNCWPHKPQRIQAMWRYSLALQKQPEAVRIDPTSGANKNNL